MTIHLDDHLVATTMRTPGHDFELAVGFCFTDGLLGGAPVRTCRYCGTGPAVDSDFNVVSVDTGGLAPAPTPRLGVTSTRRAGCAARPPSTSWPTASSRSPRRPRIPLEVLAAMAERIRRDQRLFESTGAVHAAAAFDVDRHRRSWCARTSVGTTRSTRSWGGCCSTVGCRPTGLGLYVSGRASFELVQKAWAAGFAALVAVSAPTSLAVATAERADLVLAGFVRGDRMNVYAEHVPAVQP